MKALEKIKPSKQEEKAFKVIVDSFLKKLNSVLGDARGVLGGSGAKGTWLKGVHDVDIFILFDYKKYKEKSHKLADELEKRLKKKFKKYSRLHGSRDYFQIKEDGFTYELVPILKIKKAAEAVNITDISPLHAEWVRKKSNEKIRDDIRLAKAFCKAQDLYGAESYIRGFSGYVLEILVIYYRGFERFLEKAKSWREKQVIDPEKWYADREAAIASLNESKLHSPIILIDPVDKDRNAAAALGREKFLVLKEKAVQFLKKPAEDFFVKKEIKFDDLKKKKGHLVYFEVEALRGKEDIVGCKLLQVFDFLKKGLREFDIIEAGWDWNKLWFLVKKKETDKFEVRKGPPVKLEKYAADFKKKNKKTYIEKGRLMAKIPRKDYKLKEFVKNKLKSDYVKERVKKIKVISFSF
ncbi:CCA tRNA nucleotidyltransferase [Candidatus Woesearchaeota archaeon]|nr:CCA tRNA nucleotidyltransferase [Candidatus Woesearchaeota archaeon]